MAVPVMWRGTTPHGEDWVLARRDEGFTLRHGPDEIHIPASGADRISVTRRWWRTTVNIAGVPERAGVLHGLSGDEGRRLEEAVQEALSGSLAAWTERLSTAIETSRRDLRWITEDEVTALLSTRPSIADGEPAVVGHASGAEPLWLTEEGTRRWVRTVNDEVAVAVIQSRRSFFDTVESSPLTDEQARAVVTYDNRVNVIAAAGSGKTSVMVARAAYAVSRELAKPEEIVLLAFNKDAATELQTRIQRRFTAAGLPAQGVEATTFHAFGLKIIGQATGRKPTVAPWLTNNDELGILSQIVAELKAADPRFRHAWDWFRLLLFTRPEEDFAEPSAPDAWDPVRRAAGYRAMDGTSVKSEGERWVANFLYLHGVTYEYERPYPHDTADAEHRQYHPDFYYPDIDVWHEHWGLDANGNPHPGWTDYLEGVAWKRQLHREHGTTLVETTWAEVMEGDGLSRLEKELVGHGIRLDWDPDRPPVRGVKVVTDADMLRLVRTFMLHVKANSLDRQEVERRLGAGRVRNRRRASIFLDLYWPIHDTWQARLAAGGFVDFEDMLVQAADHLESGRYVSPYRLVMVDELQDASQARARLTRALVAQPGRHLLAVGDDWQSINRFAGADLSVVTGFHDQFGPGPTVHLTKTFRCHQSITDTAAHFVRKNPDQVRKTVVSVHDRPVDPAGHEGVQLRTVPSAAEVPRAIGDFLTQLRDAIREGAIAADSVSVDVLGRYHQDRGLMPRVAPPGIHLAFRTIHSAKGLEADYVVIPNLSAGSYAFPSRIADDSVLALAMTGGDAYPHAEERRLFYVALTRARRGVLLISPEHNPSPFVTELVQDGLVRDVGPRPVATPCPGCRVGVLRPRSGRTGHFWGCSTFPACTYTCNTVPLPGERPSKTMSTARRPPF
ncbi:UvrD-helicase domain-containing protein [Ornithinimicrobium sp. LYQ92]|uniref:UvrD-helicase domain-containing protein n=1 Tax=Serinicoccus sp. LYQ92 TaxID=3378798 RepID=UPI003853A6ED